MASRKRRRAGESHGAQKVVGDLQIEKEGHIGVQETVGTCQTWYKNRLRILLMKYSSGSAHESTTSEHDRPYLRISDSIPTQYWSRPVCLETRDNTTHEVTQADMCSLKLVYSLLPRHPDSHNQMIMTAFIRVAQIGSLHTLFLEPRRCPNCPLGAVIAAIEAVRDSCRLLHSHL